jgi:broad specificity phosphatase PhoE
MGRREFLLASLALGVARSVRADDDFLWKQLRAGGNVLLMRHASTQEGLGDPEGFRIGDCTTQRNLSPQGREESKRIGERLRREKVPIARVFSSPWCRCIDTAWLAFGHVEEWEPRSSFFDFPDREAQYTASVKQRIATYASRKPPGNVVMVTHNVNIAALTKLSVATGEIVVVRPDGCCGLRTLGRLLIE